MSPYDPLKHGPKRIVGPGFHEQVHKLVGTVPPGSVTTYGDIGAALGSSTVARHVGYAMAALPEGHGVPWWRVVAAGGRLSQLPGAADEQAAHLAAEGIEVRNLRVQQFPLRRHQFGASQDSNSPGLQ
ncbi:MAG TPA: MGMT family protein [Planctomycetes bacterium]|nr:MGMT family protein [Planctomycetota bacterium]